jgi:hypothetical protein
MASIGIAMTPTPANTINRIQLNIEVTATTYTGKVVRTLHVSDGTPPPVASHANPVNSPPDSYDSV